MSAEKSEFNRLMRPICASHSPVFDYPHDIPLLIVIIY